MKKFFAMAAVAALMLTGCVNNEMFEDAEPAEIVMQAVNKVPNKAIVEGATFSGDFKVFGFFSEDDFANTEQFGMYDVVCTKVGGVYKNSTTSYYWPMSGKVGFYAVAPASIAPTVSWADGLTLTNYNVNGAKDTDVMFAYNWGAKGSSALKMTFYHALSQVLVKVKTNENYANAVIKVKSVSFTNVDVEATCNYEESSTADQVANPSITWTGNTDYTATEEYYATESAAVTSSAANYGAGILTIPQEMNANAKISIAYTLTQNGKTIEGTVSPSIATADDWVAGKRYIYTLNFKLDEITFDPEVVDTGWVDVNVDAITIE